jgi:renal tumor antigen
MFRVDGLKDYELLGKVGQGNFSSVFRVEHRDTHQRYAMKVLAEHFPATAKVNSWDELSLMRRLAPHPNVVTLHDAIFEPAIGRLSMVLDLLDGNLLEVMQAKGRPFPLAAALGFTRQLLAALGHIHSAGFVHRDVKPENCFVSGGDLKLGDFGSTRDLSLRRPLTEDVATRGDRPPEGLLSNGACGQEMDAWAAGCISGGMLLGRPLFPGTNALDQLSRIHSLLGSPSPDVLARVCPSEKLKRLEFLKCHPRKLESLFRNIGEDALDLLSGLLKYVPSERLTPAAALKHPAFALTLVVRQQIAPLPAAAVEPEAQPPKPITRKPSGGPRAPTIVVPKGNLARTPVRRKNIGSPPKHANAPQTGSGSLPQLIVVGVSRRKMKFAPGAANLPDLRNE